MTSPTLRRTFGTMPIMTKLSPAQRLATVLNERVEELGWNQAELSRQAQVSEVTVRRMQSAEEQSYQIKVKRAVSTALGWTPDSIDRVLRGEDPVVADLPAGFAAKSNLDISDLPAADRAMVTAMVERLRRSRGES